MGSGPYRGTGPAFDRENDELGVLVGLPRAGDKSRRYEFLSEPYAVNTREVVIDLVGRCRNLISCQ